MKATPRSSACICWVSDERPAARAESLRLVAENTDSIRFDQGALTVGNGGEIGAHLRPDAMQPPGLLSSFGRDDAVRVDHVPDEGMVEFAVELHIGQHPANPR